MPTKLLAIRTPARYKFLWGGRGGAKSESVAKELLKIGNEKPVRILCTREIQLSIKDSVYTLLNDLIKDLHYNGYKATENSIKHTNDTEFIFIGMWRQEVKQTMKSLANIDYCWVEEAQTISDGSLKLLDPTIRKPESEIWFTFNRLMPDDPVWLFKNKIENENKIEININYNDNNYLPKVLENQALRSKREYENKENDEYLHIWLGEPVGFSERTLISSRDVQEAAQRELDLIGQIQVGADIARYGNDRTVFFKRKGNSIIDYKIYTKQSLTETARLLIDFLGNDTTIITKIDDTGLGGGVTDYLKDFGFSVQGINFGGSPKDKDKYNNCISEMWFEFKQNIKEYKIPDIQELRSELTTREWKLDNKGRRCIESKDDYKKRGFRSPDLADALLLCFYNIEVTAMFNLGSVI